MGKTKTTKRNIAGILLYCLNLVRYQGTLLHFAPQIYIYICVVKGSFEIYRREGVLFYHSGDTPIDSAGGGGEKLIINY